MNETAKEVLDRVNAPRSWQWRRVMAFGSFLFINGLATILLLANPSLTESTVGIVVMVLWINAGILTLYFGNSAVVDGIATFRGLGK